MCSYLSYIRIYLDMFNYVHVITYAAIEVNGDHIINGDLTLVRVGHYSANGVNFDYFRDNTGVETVTSTGPLVNPVTVQVGLYG